MDGLPVPDQDPLAGHHKYVKIGDISSGSYGFVVLAHDRSEDEDVRTRASPVFPFIVLT